MRRDHFRYRRPRVEFAVAVREPISDSEFVTWKTGHKNIFRGLTRFRWISIGRGSVKTVSIFRRAFWWQPGVRIRIWLEIVMYILSVDAAEFSAPRKCD